MTDIDLIEFASSTAQAERMADLVCAQLRAAIAKKGTASMALSGGSTPAALYTAMAQRDLPWSCVTAVLVDERWTPPGTEGSNEQFLCDTLCQSHAHDVNIVGMWADTPCAADAVDIVSERYEAVAPGPFDVVVMGMGPDGHTASWFPGAENLSEILMSDRRIAASIVPQTPVTGSLTDRMTLTPCALDDAGLCCLLLKGYEKRGVFRSACGAGGVDELPIRELMRRHPDMWAVWTA